MFDVACDLMVQLIEILPGYLVLFLIFDFLGSFFFGKN